VVDLGTVLGSDGHGTVVRAGVGHDYLLGDTGDGAQGPGYVFLLVAGQQANAQRHDVPSAWRRARDRTPVL
jgi:hypothetical protein